MAACLNVKVQVEDIWYSTSLLANPITEALRYGARFQRITQFYLPLTHLSTNRMNYTCLCLPSWSLNSFTKAEEIEGWVGLGTSKVSKQSAQDCYVMEITVISCSDRHASPGNWKHRRLWASNSRPLWPKASMLTHYTTESPFTLLIIKLLQMQGEEKTSLQNCYPILGSHFCLSVYRLAQKTGCLLWDNSLFCMTIEGLQFYSQLVCKSTYPQD